jgi:iron(III) transport system ATP-binding protein
VTVLKLEALRKTFQRAGTVVNSVDLEINEGEFFTLLGPSGCGKSTILRMIAGLEEPDSGRIRFEGRDVTLDPPNKRGIGMVFQNYALFPHLSVAQNVAFGLEVRKTPTPERNQRTDSALKRVQLDSLGAARVDQLSGGQQQRVALARALVIQPKLLLLDEPLSNLDAKLRGETRTMLRAVHSASKVTTIYVTHDQEEGTGNERSHRGAERRKYSSSGLAPRNLREAGDKVCRRLHWPKQRDRRHCGKSFDRRGRS